MAQDARQNPRNAIYRPFPGDSSLVVAFFTEPVENPAKSKIAGHPVYEDREMVSVSIPGDRQTTAIARANTKWTSGDGEIVTYKERFPDDYDRFLKDLAPAVQGTPLTMVAFLSKAAIKTLNSANVFSVEQLADMGGQPLKNLGAEGRKWQQQALAYLEDARGHRDAVADAAEKEEMRARIAALEEMLANKGGAPVVEAVPFEGDTDEFAAMSDDDIKEWIKAKTGTPLKGNYGRDGLIRKAQELMAQEENGI